VITSARKLASLEKKTRTVTAKLATVQKQVLAPTANVEIMKTMKDTSID